jgi:hypothetical protein
VPDRLDLAVDRSLIPTRLNRLEFYGYYFDTTQIQVLLDNSGGTVDESGKLARPTHYHLTLNLGGNGVQIGPTSQRLRLRWNEPCLRSRARLPGRSTQVTGRAAPPYTEIPTAGRRGEWMLRPMRRARLRPSLVVNRVAGRRPVR